MVAMTEATVNDFFDALPAPEGMEKLTRIGERGRLCSFVKRFKNVS
jgi:hypothetical protein